MGELAVRLFKLLDKNVIGTREINTEVVKYISVVKNRNASKVFNRQEKFTTKIIRLLCKYTAN